MTSPPRIYSRCSAQTLVLFRRLHHYSTLHSWPITPSSLPHSSSQRLRPLASKPSNLSCSRLRAVRLQSSAHSSTSPSPDVKLTRSLPTYLRAVYHTPPIKLAILPSRHRETISLHRSTQRLHLYLAPGPDFTLSLTTRQSHRTAPPDVFISIWLQGLISPYPSPVSLLLCTLTTRFLVVVAPASGLSSRTITVTSREVGPPVIPHNYSGPLSRTFATFFLYGDCSDFSLPILSALEGGPFLRDFPPRFLPLSP